MNEGFVRLLASLADGEARGRTALARSAGEPLSVVRALLASDEGWCEAVEGDRVRITERGLAALGRVLGPRRHDAPAEEALPDVWKRLAERRGPPKRGLDQVYATEASVRARVERLASAGEVARGIAFLGDDDLTSAALFATGGRAPVTVFEIDTDLVAILREAAERETWSLRVIEHDLRRPVPRAHLGAFGCVFTDPPYAPEGFRLFLSRAIDLLADDGRIYACFGQSRRASERGLDKQRAIADAGLLVEEVVPDFSRYDGASSIGARSALWVLARTPRTRPLVRGSTEGDLYTSRSPRRIEKR